MKHPEKFGIFSQVNKTLRFRDLLGTRIPGVRKVIEYGAQKQILKSRMWLVICLATLSIMIYHINYYLQMYINQTIHIIRSYDYPSKVAYPSIIMCSPTSFSFSRLINHRSLISKILNNLDGPSMYSFLLEQRDTNLTSSEILNLLKLRIEDIIVECTFQTKPCNVSGIKLYNYASHACFIINAGRRFFTTIAGRDGGLEILLNLNVFDGIEERQGLPGGLQINFYSYKYMEMPHPRDVIYLDSGRLNSINLISQKYASIINCSDVSQLPSNPETGSEDTQRDQVLYYNRSYMLPCTMQNYYSTKTTAKLLSNIVYAKMTLDNKRRLNANARRSNELKSIFVPEIRNRDSTITKKLSMLSHKLEESFQKWNKPKCSYARYKLNTNITATYVRGKADAIETYVKGQLDQVRRSNELYGSLYKMRVEQLVGSLAGNLLTLDFKRNGGVLEILKLASIEWQSFIQVEVIERKQWLMIMQVLGDVTIFKGSTEYMMRTDAKKYYDAHVDLRRQILLLSNWYIANKDFVIKNVPFAPAENVSILCSNSKNNSVDYGTCPDEIKCPDFDHTYTTKYNMPFVIMRDSMTAPLQHVHASVYQFCTLAVILKDIVRAFGLDMMDSDAPWFDLYRLNQLATAHWEDQKIFDRKDIECRTFQACWRLASHIHSEGQGMAGDNFRCSFDYHVMEEEIMNKIGALGFGYIQSAKMLIQQSYPYLKTYIQAYKEVVVLPYEKFHSTMTKFRSVVSSVRDYAPPRLLFQPGVSSLIEELAIHLHNHIQTGNMSLLAHFMNRRGRIMVGRMRIYAQEVHDFITISKTMLRQIYGSSLRIHYQLNGVSSFKRLMNQDVMASVLSRNVSYALQVVDQIHRCVKTILKSLELHGQDTLERLNDWLVNIPQLLSLAKQYENDQTLNANFVQNNFVRLEIYYGDLAESTAEEQYPLSKSALMSRFGAIGRFYMGLKIFNVAEFLGPILLFVLYRIYLFVIQ